MEEEAQPEADAREAESNGDQQDKALEKAADTETEDEEVEVETAALQLRKMQKALSKKRRTQSHAELRFRRPGERAVQVSLDRTTTVIGRDDACDIVLAEECVSRRHARIVKNDEGYFMLTDLSSTNGIRVDGVVVPRMLLCEGDRFSIGETQFLVSITDDEE